MRLPPRHQRDVLKIGELADELGTTPRTIRLYEDLGLIVPERTRGGTRLYARKDVKRMAIALRLGRSGIALDVIQQLAREREGSACGKDAVATLTPLLEELIGNIRASRTELEALEHDLERAKRLIRQCADCPNRPNRQDCPTCPVDKNVDSTDIARLIWDPNCP